jgi:hypothetical protein
MPLGKFLLSEPLFTVLPHGEARKKEFSRKNIPTRRARKDEGKCPENRPKMACQRWAQCQP